MDELTQPQDLTDLPRVQKKMRETVRQQFAETLQQKRRRKGHHTPKQKQELRASLAHYNSISQQHSRRMANKHQPAKPLPVEEQCTSTTPTSMTPSPTSVEASEAAPSTQD